MEEALSSNALIYSNFTIGHELEGEDSWVVIKKQRITILIPPPSPAPIQTESPRMKRIHNKSIKAVQKRSNTPGKRHHRCSKTELMKPLVSPSELENRINHSDPPDPRTGASSLQTPRTWRSLRTRQVLRRPLDSGLEATNQSQVLRRPLVGTLEATNQRLRASNLESKLEMFGGLKRWLSSAGLDQFVPFFEMGNLDKYQLVNLTMDKLKDMGANAVGPRRKLIHAIESLCQPYYVKVL